MGFRAHEKNPAFNDIAEHDVTWGSYHVPYDNKLNSLPIQYVLSLGLENIQKIAGAKSYEDRHLLLYSSRGPPATDFSLYEGLHEANETNGGIILRDFTTNNEGLGVALIKSPFFDDPDYDPVDVWRWAHQKGSGHNWIYREYRDGLRQWGYVMWV